MSLVPDRINIDKKDRELYEKLDSEELFKKSRRSRKEQFMFAMALGFKNGIHVPLESREGFFLYKDMSTSDEALFNTVAITDQNTVDILADKKEVFRIAEEYAHGGISLLIDDLNKKQLGTYDKKLEEYLMEIFGSLD
jgi:dnd system-associated protein 4